MRAKDRERNTIRETGSEGETEKWNDFQFLGAVDCLPLTVEKSLELPEETTKF